MVWQQRDIIGSGQIRMKLPRWRSRSLLAGNPSLEVKKTVCAIRALNHTFLSFCLVARQPFSPYQWPCQVTRCPRGCSRYNPPSLRPLFEAQWAYGTRRLGRLRTQSVGSSTPKALVQSLREHHYGRHWSVVDLPRAQTSQHPRRWCKAGWRTASRARDNHSPQAARRVRPRARFRLAHRFQLHLRLHRPPTRLTPPPVRLPPSTRTASSSSRTTR